MVYLYQINKHTWRLVGSLRPKSPDLFFLIKPWHAENESLLRESLSESIQFVQYNYIIEARHFKMKLARHYMILELIYLDLSIN